MGYTAMGDYDGVDSSSDFNNAGSGIERKTTNLKKENSSPTGKNYYSTKKASTNVLNNYRSVSYNFTLAAISAKDANHPEKYNINNPKFILATSKGKNKDDRISVGLKDSLSNTISNIINPSSKPKYDVSGDIESFNQTSPGSFDLFIDDVVIDSTFSFKDGAVTLPLKFDFEVIEPYSLNGFIEALQICALATGYTEYTKASYVMILDFMGIPDVGDTPLPQIVPNSSKMFFIRITGIQVSVTDSGTKYKVSAVALGDMAVGSAVANTKRKITGEGNTVKQLLTNIVDGLNTQSKNNSKSLSNNQSMFDSYEILFPIYNEKGEIVEGKSNEIASAGFWDDIASANSNPAMTEIGSSPSAYQPAGTSTRPILKNQSQSTLSHQHTAQFDSGVPITDLISSVIRDSNYVKKVIKAFQNGGDPSSVLDANGFLNYFIITPKIFAKDGPINTATNQPYYTYIYLVEVYKVIYNMAVPGTGNQAIDSKKIQNFSLRNYRYFYTGLNTDIIDFKINLNNLFFEEIPNNMGNNNSDASADSAKSGNSNNTKLGQSTKDTGVKVSTFETPDASTVNPGDMPNSTAPDGKGWQQMVKIMHERVSNSVGFITGNLVILGDPYYLTATGSGNSLNKNSKFGQLANGQEAATRAGMVLISLAFNNPFDIGDSGFIKFSDNNVPISGLYQITLVKSSFKDGIFKQDLSIIRLPGQTDESPDNPANAFSSYPNPEDQIVASSGPPPPSYTVTTNDGTLGFRADSLNLKSLINRQLLEFPGGLGGNDNPVFGAINPAGGLSTAIYGIIPQGANQLATGIRASASGLYSKSESNLGNAALAVGASKVFDTLYPGSNNTPNLISSNLTNNQRDLKSSLNNNSLNSARSNTSNIIGNAGNRINQAINGTSKDVQGLANLFGIIPSLVSGITGNLQSKILSSISGLSNVIPANVNLKTASKFGVRVDGLTPTGLSKLPPMPEPAVGLRAPGFSNNESSSYSLYNNSLANRPQLPEVDNVTRSMRESSGYSLYSQISNKPLSVEANYSTFDQNLSKSVVVQYGSQSKNQISPLITALNNSNNNNNNVA
jgi:hypothetical protein